MRIFGVARLALWRHTLTDLVVRYTVVFNSCTTVRD